MEKTLGQIHIDAYEAGPTGEKGAHAIAAVARHVVGEMLAKHVAECHTPRPRLPNEIPPSVTPPQPRASDWAHKAYIAAYGCNAYTESAKVIREAAERHYGAIITRATLDRNAAQRERDAARERVKELELLLLNERQCIEESYRERDAARDEAERLRNELDKVLADVERNKQPTPAAATGDDELKQLRKDVYDEAFDALRSHYLNTSSVESAAMSLVGKIMRHFRYHHQTLFDAVLAERDKFAAELQELQEAVIASPPMSLRHTTTGTPYWTYTGAELTHPNKLSAILAAYRATKGKEPTDAK